MNGPGDATTSSPATKSRMTKRGNVDAARLQIRQKYSNAQGVPRVIGDRWYKREPRAFLDGVQGMGPELIGAYSVILDVLYARGGDMPRDDRHLAGVMGCSARKAKALTDHLVALGKIEIVGGKIRNARANKEISERSSQGVHAGKNGLKERETSVKQSRNGDENGPTYNENNHLVRQNRIEENRIDTHPNGCGADAPVGEDFWSFSSRILQRSGISDREARSLLGKWTKAKGRDEIRSMIAGAMQAADPVAFVEASMPKEAEFDEKAFWEGLRKGQEEFRAGR